MKFQQASLIAAFSLAAHGLAWISQVNAQVKTYPGLDSLRSSVYQVRVRPVGGSWQPSFTWQLRNTFTASDAQMTERNHWTTFAMQGRTEVEVRIFGKRIDSAGIKPSSMGITTTLADSVVRFVLDQPAKLHVKIRGLVEDPLFVFAKAPAAGRPDPSSDSVWSLAPGSKADISTIPAGKKVVFFQPGIHRVGKLKTVRSNTTYWFEGGSFVLGNFFGDNLQNVRFAGHGILSGAEIPHSTWNGCRCFDGVSIQLRGNGRRNYVVEGLTIVDPAMYAIQAYGGHLVTRDVQVFGQSYETDGWVGGNGSRLENSFFKVNDDVVKLYFDSLLVQDLVIWKQFNGAPFQLGWGSESGSDNLVRRIDILTDETHSSKVTSNRSLLNHAAGSGSTVQRMTLEDIRVESKIAHVIGLKTTGTVRDITLRRIRIDGAQGWPSYLNGGTIANITFDQVTMGGSCVDGPQKLALQTTGTVSGTRYLCGSTTTSQGVPSVAGDLRLRALGTTYQARSLHPTWMRLRDQNGRLLSQSPGAVTRWDLTPGTGWRVLETSQGSRTFVVP